MPQQTNNPLDRFKAIGWRVSAEHDAVLDELAKLDLSSPWPEIFEPNSSKKGVLLQIYEACRAFSRGKLTVRSFDRWIESAVTRRGGKPIKSGYHRLMGRLNLDRNDAGLLLDCLFSGWGALRKELKKEKMSHGLEDDPDDIYFGLPSNHPDKVRDRILAELYPVIEPPTETFGINESARIIVGRYSVILGPPRGWAIYAFHEWAIKMLPSSSGTLIFVIDLGRMRSGDPHDFHAFFNLAELHAAILTLAIFANRATEGNGAAGIALQRGVPAWASKEVNTERPTDRPHVWSQLKKRIAFAVHGLPDQFRRENTEIAKREFRDKYSDSGTSDRLVREALEADFGISTEHIFPRTYGVGLAHTLNAAHLEDADFLTMNVWIEQEAHDNIAGPLTEPQIKVTHSFLWTKPDQRSHLITKIDELTPWWENPEQYAGGTARIPFQEPACELAFSMVQQAAALRLAENLSEVDRERGLRSLAYLNSKLNLSFLTLEEFIDLPLVLYRQHHSNKNNDGE